MKKFKLFMVFLLTISLLPIQSAVFAGNDPVKIENQYFSTLKEAVQTAKDSNKPAKIEIVGDTILDSDITISSEVELVNSGDSHKIEMGTNKIKIDEGKLTLGDGKNSDYLSLLSTNGTITANDGTIVINDGVKIISKGGEAVYLEGTSATASINGGELEGGQEALALKAGASVNLISGGIFKGRRNAVYLYGDISKKIQSKIKKISGGEFYQTDEDATLHGHTVLVDRDSHIGEISGGYFSTKCSTALAMTRGGSVGTISGGEFVHTTTGGIVGNVDGRTASVKISGDEGLVSSIGAITGGKFYGGHFGLLSVARSITDPPLGQIGSISGGNFAGKVGFQNDIGCTTHEISGGNFHGSVTGIVNNGDIKKINGSSDIKADTQYGIYNHPYGTIHDISGGKIESKYKYGYGIFNVGVIKQISGGMIIGEQNAIYNSDTSSKGKFERITGGVFWGKSSSALVLVDTLDLEPGLDSKIGKARFWGKNGTIFNNETLVTLPKNAQLDTMYYMSPNTISVNGISETGFKYLKLPSWDLKFDANIPQGSDGTGINLPDDQISIDLDAQSHQLGSPSGAPVTSGGIYAFDGWNTQSNGEGDTYEETEKINSQPQDTIITMYAQWKFTAIEEKVDENVGDTYSIETENTSDDNIKINKNEQPGSSQKLISQKKISEKNSPETGDISLISMWITILLITMLAAVSVQLYRSKLFSKKIDHK